MLFLAIMLTIVSTIMLLSGLTLFGYMIFVKIQDFREERHAAANDGNIAEDPSIP